MSSKFRLTTPGCAALSLVLCARSVSATPLRFADVVTLPGVEVSRLEGQPIDRLGLFACTPAECHPIPFQVDERDAAGAWVLDDERPSAGGLDGNALVLFMAADAGAPVRRDGFAAAAGTPVAPAYEIALHDPLDHTIRYAYLAGFADHAPRAAAVNVAYDPITDRVQGARVSLGFTDGMPGYLALDDGVNLLDRFKVRAAATFLFGLIHFSRSEADLRTQFMGWHAGPIRVVRGQRQWVRLGWGIHSPTFGSYTYFYRDFAELPVGLRLNFKPTYFFGNIVVQAILDFRDLTGWSVLVPSIPDPLPITGAGSDQQAALAQLSDKWFALRGPQVTLVESMDVSPSLATVRHRLAYRETTHPMPPEAVPGEEPGIGFQLDQWEHVGAGAHQLQSVSYALPPDVDVRAFMHARATPLEVSVHAMTNDR